MSTTQNFDTFFSFYLEGGFYERQTDTFLQPFSASLKHLQLEKSSDDIFVALFFCFIPHPGRVRTK